MNRFLLTVTAIALAVGAPLGHAAATKSSSYSLAYGSSLSAEIDPCG